MTIEWQPSEGITPTQELMDIILCDQSISVLAGAGAGKTELLAQKSNYLLQTGKCMWPKRILCLSYKKRLRKILKSELTKDVGKEVSVLIRILSMLFVRVLLTVLRMFYLRVEDL